jgi:hypothetical protein
MRCSAIGFPYGVTDKVNGTGISLIRPPRSTAAANMAGLSSTHHELQTIRHTGNADVWADGDYRLLVGLSGPLPSTANTSAIGF